MCVPVSSLVVAGFKAVVVDMQLANKKGSFALQTNLAAIEGKKGGILDASSSSQQWREYNTSSLAVKRRSAGEIPLRIDFLPSFVYFLMSSLFRFT